MVKLAAKDSSQQWWLVDTSSTKEGDQQVETTTKAVKMAIHVREGDGANGFQPWPREKRKVELRVAAIVAS